MPGSILLAGVLGLAGAARAQSSDTVTMSVNATAAGAPLERVWPFHGYDEINYTTTPEGKALLAAIAAAHTSPVHVRTHFLLNSGDGTAALKWGSTNVYTEDGAGNPVYTWGLTDGILDTITGVGAFPLVELAFMPQALSSHPTPYRNSSTLSLDGGCFYPPADYAKWAALIRAWATHARERYPDAAASWLWELWNEPDIGYWHGTLADFAKLYDHTEAALHEVLPDAQLGGPAVASAGSIFLKQFLEHCATGTNAVTGQTGTRLDLVTFHAKGGVAVNGDHVQMDLGNQLRLHRAGFNAVASVAPFKQVPIYITEADPDGCAACPAGSVPADAYRNSTAYGAYEIAMMKHTLELASQRGVRLGGLLTWAFTFPGTPYFAGYRALTTNGIDMPVLSAFRLLGRLQGARLPLTSTGAHALDDILTNGVRDQGEVDGMATRAGDTVQVLVWSYHDDLVSVPATPVHLAIKLPMGTVPTSFGSRVRVSHQRVDEAHGDAYTTWVNQGSPANPSPDQVTALEQAMVPSALVPDTTLPLGADGILGIDFELPRFGISLLTIEPAAAAGDEGELPEPAVHPNPGCACHLDGRATGHDAENGLLLGLGAALLAATRRIRKTRRPRVTETSASDILSR